MRVQTFFLIDYVETVDDSHSYRCLFVVSFLIPWKSFEKKWKCPGISNLYILKKFLLATSFVNDSNSLCAIYSTYSSEIFFERFFIFLSILNSFSEHDRQRFETTVDYPGHLLSGRQVYRSTVQGEHFSSFFAQLKRQREVTFSESKKNNLKNYSYFGSRPIKR